MDPVEVPKLYKGQDARAALRVTHSALIAANARLIGSGRWYDGVRQAYAVGALPK